LGSTRIKGSALSLAFDGVDYWADVTQVRLTNIPIGDPMRAHGNHAVIAAPRQYLIKGTAAQSLDDGSFWRYAWANAQKIVDFRYAPLGNHEPAADAPHFIGRVQIGPRPTVGGNAGNKEYEFEFEWEVIGEPDLDDGNRLSHNY